MTTPLQYQNYTSDAQANTIEEFTDHFGFPAPSHPLMTLIRLPGMNYDLGTQQTIQVHLYSVVFKQGVKGSTKYGWRQYDFSKGFMSFFTPGQIVPWDDSIDLADSSGWLYWSNNQKTTCESFAFGLTYSALTVCQAISIAITVVLPAPVASFSAKRISSGLASLLAFAICSSIATPDFPILGATSVNQIAVSTASIWQKNGRIPANS